MARASNNTIDVDTGIGGVWTSISAKTANYTILDADLGAHITLGTGASAGDTTITLKATPTDADTVWISNQNSLATKRLVVSDGVDDVLFMDVGDGVAKFTYSSSLSAWSID